MTLVITWGHVEVIAAVLGLLGTLVGWLINRFDKAQERDRQALLDEINEKNAFREKAEGDLQAGLKAAWVKIDHLVTQSVERKEIELIRSEFKEDMDRWGTRLEVAIGNLGMRVDNLAAKVRNAP